MEKKVSTRTIFEGKVVKLVEDEVVIDEDKHTKREVVIHHGGACIALKNHDGKYFLVKQYRYAQGCDMLEFCAGKLEAGENPDQAIIREAREELGYHVKNLIKLGEMIPTCAYSTEHIHLYYGEADEYVGCDFDEDERISTVELSYQELVEMIKDNQIIDAKTMCIVQKIALLGLA